ncbi:kinesin-like protein KIN-7G [Lactuca sativa]|uniref:Kinesin-like protein n=1 Tax=Lactuca sativa TaxID=4236 RepID=A0A9R1WJ33_LACSA|nr:kinesin-like protein KIN-7G [Lactuca sativa]XP_042755306.1 kinesin-like protein KIN-7G [Lactuca sativa]KAJ0224729.1 hypothetical protein LSAT_V11C100007140 [Lactuca sativa]
MKSLTGDEINQGGGQEPGAHGEKIFVSVRVRPLNEKEIAKNDSCDWECVSNDTILYKSGLAEQRSTHPNAYTFDRVYGCDSTTKQVYEEGVKKVALSALNGINSSVFAYGQTSSGKTYTMTGITQYAISDIFDYIKKQNDREFVLKFSAIEIYNECVRDLLSADGTQLRLLDDPVKGTVVDKLTEIRLKNWTHLMQLLGMCEAQRHIGETSMNEVSSRSHQIIRLTIESSPSEFARIGSASSLTATVNFVDLAGSERASQTLSAGTRLKEGCHINRSLLTLGTVIRKLSKSRNGHVPYRDSKLTRILQNSLGGNARTAIVCTLSPAHAHLEQSRNTLLFAVCAKEVRTSAQVNVVVSEKALVKQLQREMERLQRELKNMSAANNNESVIKEKESQIEDMQQEIKDLTQERDLARTRLEEILRAAGIDQSLLPWNESRPLRTGSWDGRLPSSDTSFNAPITTYSKDELNIPNEDSYFFDRISSSQFMDRYLPDPSHEWEKSRSNSSGSCKELECMENDQEEQSSRSSGSSVVDKTYSRTASLTRSTSCSAVIEEMTPEYNVVAESMVTKEVEGDASGRSLQSKSESDIKSMCRQDSDEKDMKQSEGSVFIYSPTRTLKEVMRDDLKGEYVNYMAETPRAIGSAKEDNDWELLFEEQRRKIIKLWDECNIPLIHRTYFFLLIQGDPSDSVYIEIELRRLSFLQKAVDHASSTRAMDLERAMLSRKLLRKYSAKEREGLFVKWGVDLQSRNRRVQLSQLLWTKTDDMEHAKESAEIVAKLVGLVDPSQTPKEMLFAPTQESQTMRPSWRDTFSLLGY